MEIYPIVIQPHKNLHRWHHPKFLVITVEISFKTPLNRSHYQENTIYALCCFKAFPCIALSHRHWYHGGAIHILTIFQLNKIEDLKIDLLP